MAAAVGSTAVYAYGAARYRRSARRGFEFVDAPQPGSAAFGRLVEGITGAPLRSGNRLSVLRNGGQTFPAMLAAIASADATIALSSYIYWPGEIATEFTVALAERARAGVEVNVVLDAWGSAKLDRATVGTLRDAGATVALFRPPHWYTLQKLNNRMHRRLLIVDGRIGFAGGVGIADVWTGDAQGPGHWRETHVAIEGPSVRDLLGGFLENWTEATQVVLGPAHLPDLAGFDDGIEVQVTRSSPTGGGTAAARLFYAAIAGARERVWLMTAYFAPGAAFIDVLCGAAARGADVQIVVNGPNIDKEVVRRSGQRCYGQLLEAGVRIFEYQPTMLHAKVLIADTWANIGSSNLDHRSLGLDDELNVSVRDPGVVAELAGHFVDDVAVSEEFDLRRWKDRSLARRAVESASDLVRQSL